MKTNTLQSIALVIATAVLSGCVTVSQIYTDFDPFADFQSYSTFSWANVAPVTHLGNHDITSRTDRNVIEAIRATLTAKGYRYVNDIEDADLGVAISIGAMDGVDLVDNDIPGLINTSDLRWAYRYGPSYSVNNYTDGTMAIDFIDMEIRSPIWHSRGTKRLNRAELNADDDRESVTEAVRQILESFPVKN